MKNNLKILYDDVEESLEFWIGNLMVTKCSERAFNKHYSNVYIPRGAEMIPFGLRYMNENTIIYETKPQYRQINYTANYQTDISDVNKTSDYSFYIPMPWMVYVITLSPQGRVEQIRGFFAQKPIPKKKLGLDYASKGISLYSMPLHNWYEDDTLCRPVYTDLENDSNSRSSLFSIINEIENETWNSGFNNDLIINVANYYNWVFHSEEPPDFDNTIFAYNPLPSEYWVRLYDNNLNDFFRMFYSTWQNMTVKDILHTSFIYRVRSDYYLQEGVIPVDNCKWNTRTSQILTAAQNASME